jgi:hypothetical protein
MAVDRNSKLAAAKAVAFHAIQLLIQDIKDLVAKHVRTSIRQGLNDPDPKISHHAHERKKWLASWEKDNFPLTWNSPNSEKGSYSSLLVILNSDPSLQCLQALQHSSDRLSYSELASSLVAYATSGKQQVMAPIISKGYFVTALPAAIKLMEPLKPENKLLADFASDVLAVMFQKLEIHFLPWHSNANGPGARPRTVRPDWWMMINRKNTSLSVPANQTVAESSTSAALSVAAQDVSAP